jgi:hypothetical protein
VGLHLAALLVHRLWFGERIVLPMVTGRRRDVPPEAGVDGQRLVAGLLLAAASAAIVWWVVTRL